MDKIVGIMALAMVMGGVFVAWSGCTKDTEETAPAKEEERVIPQGREKEDMKAGNAVDADSAPVSPEGTGRHVPAATPEPVVTQERPFSTTRLLYVREHGLPPDHEGLSSPVDATEERIKRGGDLFGSRCALCHGEKGLGDGPAGRALSPQASNLSIVAGEPEVTDGYLFWAITEGGGALKTAMPSFRTIPEDERWTIILYLRERIAEKR